MISSISFCILALGRSEETLSRCMASIERQGVPDYEVLIGGINRPTQDSTVYLFRNEWTLSEARPLNEIRNEFCKRATKEFILILDAQVELDGSWYERIRQTNSWDIMASRLLDSKGKRLVDWAYPYSHANQLHSLPLDYNEWNPKAYVNGSLLLMRRQVWEHVEFNEELKEGEGDDIEFCHHATEIGFRVGACPEASAIFSSNRFMPRHFSFGSIKDLDEVPQKEAFSIEKAKERSDFLGKLRLWMKQFGFSSVCYLAAVSIPLFLVIAWHGINTVGPRADAADYYRTAQDMYLKFIDKGFFRGLESIYLLRGWRPIFFPVIILPFLVLTGNQMLATVTLTMSFTFLIFLTYAYLYAREFLSPMRSCLATLFVGTLFWVMNFTYILFSELSLMACFIAALYHMKKCNFFTSRWHSFFFCFWSILAIATRPVEFFFAFLIPFSLWIYKAWKKGNVPTEDLKKTLPFLIPASGLFAMIIFLPIHRDKLIPVAILILIAAFSGYRARKQAGGNKIYLDSFFLVFALTLFWWFPGIKKLYWWVRETTFGGLAQYYHDQGKMEVFQAIRAFFVSLGGYPLLVTASLCGLGMIGEIFNINKNRELLRSFLKFLGLSLTMLLPPVVMLAFTNDIAYRRAMPGFLVLQLTLCIFALHPKLFVSRSRFLLLALFTALQIFAVYCKTFDAFRDIRGKMWPYFEHTSSPLKGGDPTVKIFTALTPLYEKKAQIAVFSALGIDTGELNLLSTGKRAYLNFGYPTLFSSLEEGRKQLRNFDYILLDATTTFPPAQAKQEPYASMATDLARRWKEEKLEEINLKPLSTYKITGALDPSLKPPFYEIVLLEVGKA